MKLMRRLALDGARNVVACSSFPPANANSAAATLLVCRHAVALLDLPQLLLTTDPKAKRLPAKRLGAPHLGSHLVYAGRELGLKALDALVGRKLFATRRGGRLGRRLRSRRPDARQLIGESINLRS